MSRYWDWLSDAKNQKTLAFVSTGLAVAIGALWTVYKEFGSGGGPSPVSAIENACGVAIAEGSVSISGVTCSFGITLDEYEAALAEQEASLRAELTAAAENPEREAELAQDLSAVQRRLENVEQAYAQRAETFASLAQALENSSISGEVSGTFSEAIKSGDTSDLEALLTDDFDAAKREAGERAYQLALLLQQRGALAEAYETLNRAKAINPDDERIAEAIAQIEPQLDVILGDGRLRMGAVLSEGGDLVDAHHFVYGVEKDLDGNRRKVVDYYEDPSWFTLPAGTYHLVSSSGQASASRDFDVRPGVEQEAILDLNAGRLRMGAVLAEGGNLVDAHHFVYSIEKDLDGNRRKVVDHYNDPSWFTLPAGKYHLVSTSGKASASQEFEVRPGVEQEAILDLNAGRLRMGAVLSEGGDLVDAHHFVYGVEKDLDGNRRKVVDHYNDPSWFTLPAGKYHLVSSSGQASASLEFEIRPGVEQEAILDLNAGRLRMGAALSEGGDLVDAHHAVYSVEKDLDGNRRKIVDYYEDPSWFTLPAGTYHLVSWTSQASASLDFEIRPGVEHEAILVLNQ